MHSTNPASPSSYESAASPAAPASPPAAAPEAPANAKPKRIRRSADLFDAEGNPVHINLTCLCCKAVKPLAAFGLRKMPNGIIRNQPWCRYCRSSKSAAARAATPAPAPAPQNT